MSYYILQDVHCSFVLCLVVGTMLLPCCSGYVDWIYPDAETTGMTFNYNDVVYFTWTSNITSPWMKLWCKPSGTGNHTIAFEEHVETNGTKPQSFPYSKFDKDGSCHMEIEYSISSDISDTPEFTIASNDAVLPQTWGLSTVSLSGAASVPIVIASSSTEVSFIAITSVLPSILSSPSPSSIGFSSSPPPTSTAPPLASSSPPSTSPSTANIIGVSLFTIFGILLLIMTLSFYSAPFRRARGEKRKPRGFRPNCWRRWSEVNDTAEIGEGAHQPSELKESPLPELDSAPQFELEAGPEGLSMNPPHCSP